MFEEFYKKKKISLRTQKKRSNFLEPEEVLFHDKAQSKADEDKLYRLEVSFGSWGLKMIGWLGGLILVLVLISIFNHSIVEGEKFRLRAQNNSLKFITIPSDRGVIYDRFGKVLASNSVAFDLVFLPSYLPVDMEERGNQLNTLREKLDLSDEDWSKMMDIKPSQFFEGVVLKNNLSSSEAIVLESSLADFSAVQVIKQPKRQYRDSKAFSHVLGYLGRASEEDLALNPEVSNFDKIGQAGLEKSYDDILRGKSGRIAISRDARQNILGETIDRSPQGGDNLHTTLDADFQEFLYERLDKQIKSIDSSGGAVAIAMDSETGEILALVSYPVFDIEEMSSSLSQEDFDLLLRSKEKPFFNRAISGLYSPGSTLKPIIALAALEENIINPTDKVITNGRLVIPNPYNPDYPSVFVDWKNHGMVDMYSAIARSSNVYFYIVGGGFEDFKGLGINKIAEYLESFDFNSLTGIDISGENSSLVPRPENKDIWRIGDTYNTSIGQGDVLVSPIRLLVALNSIVNEGKVLTPILNSNSSKNLEALSFELENLEEVKKGMIETVESSEGTGRILNDLPFSSGGKSGTAQIFNNTQLNALFFSFAPAKDPKVSLLVLIEKAKDGALNATPVIKDALMWYFENRGF